MGNFLYLDCFSGVSGDMFLGSLLDLGIPSSLFISEIKKISIPFEIEIEKVQKQNISATQVKIREEEHHHHRPARELIRIIQESPFPPSTKEKAQEIVWKIAEVEAKIHGADPQEIYLHEVGGADTLVDIIGVLMALHMLGIEEIRSSPIPTGYGWVETAHGRLPIPAPATLELLRGIPTYSGEVEGELTTPTGAALVSSLSKSFGGLPFCQIEKVGYGAGEKDYPLPNVLRTIMGKKDSYLREEKNLMIETNIDDMSPQVVEYLTEKLFQAGALDVFVTPIFMKKQRPAFQLSVITPISLKGKMEEIILKETTTLGVREYQVDKYFLPRREIEIPTTWGKVRGKLSYWGEMVKITPEYEDCKKIAARKNIPLLQVIQEAQREGERIAEEEKSFPLGVQKCSENKSNDHSGCS